MSDQQVERNAPVGASPMNFDQSAREIAENSKWLPGGVNSNFRLNIAPTPLVFERGEGPYLYDVDGNRLIDYYLGMGPMILGHKPDSVVKAVTSQLEKGILYAGQTRLEAEVAKLFCQMVPCADRVRFSCAGSEVVQAALRIARAATGRDKFIKFEGHYHGWFDSVLWSVAPPPDQAGDESAPTPVPASRGQVAALADQVVVLPWNNLELVKARLAKGDIAAVIMEPAMVNAGSIHPEPGYLEGVREACTRAGTILIFDEVITGFRLGPGGAQELFGVTPDLATFGKALANGFPVSAVAGRGDLMDLFAQGVLHGGTFNAAPVSMAATAATLRTMTPAFYKQVGEYGTALSEGLREILARNEVTAVVTGFPQAFHVALGLEKPARSFRDLAGMNRPAYVALCVALLKRGVRVLERGVWFLSIAHDKAVIDETLAAAADAVAELKRNGTL
jgi:glutamate-1-semialdehyde 2,1-aminomutase